MSAQAGAPAPPARAAAPARSARPSTCGGRRSALPSADFPVLPSLTAAQSLTEGVGNVLYAAPELLKRKYGPEVDVWCAGGAAAHGCDNRGEV